MLTATDSAGEPSGYLLTEVPVGLRAASATPEPSPRASLGEPVASDSLRASVAVLLVLTVVQRLVGFVRGVLFCRWLDAEQLGQWDMAFGFLMLAAPLVVLGVPGSLGRYVEIYRRRGRLRPFLVAVSGLTLALGTAGGVAICLAPGFFSAWIFGSAARANLMLLVGAGLVIIVMHNYLTSLFTALRQVRFIAIFQFANSVLFAVLGVGLLRAWRNDSAAVILAFLIASALTAGGAAAWLARLWLRLPRPAIASEGEPLWRRLMPFALALWLSNAITNVFGIADRFLMLHVSDLSPEAALDMIGQYHTARIFPVLFAGVAEMLATIVTPHLISDWESGRRRRVASRLRLIVKLVAAALVAASAVVMLGAGWLFGVVWQHRYFDGWLVLPWTLATSVWYSVALVGYNYLWCAERSRWVNLSLLVGLAIDVALNLVLLPRLGLLGAALSAAAARMATLVILWWILRRLGMSVDRGLVLLAALPLLLPVSPGLTLLALALALSGRVGALACFSRRESRRLVEIAAGLRARLVGRPAG